MKNRINSLETYMLFMSLKNHFTRKNYDHFRYNGKVRISVEKFQSKNDRHVYEYLSKNYTKHQLTNLFVSNMIKGNIWAIDYSKDDCLTIYSEYARRQGSLRYVFANDVETIMKHKNPFKSKEQYPPIIHEVLNDRICMESFSILQYFLQFDEKFNKSIGEDDILWKKIRHVSTKLLPFLDFDKEEFKTILVEGIQYHGKRFS